MLFYPKTVKMQSGSTIKLSYSSFSQINSETDENILPLKYAKSAFNYIIENGALKTGYGFDYLGLPYQKENNYALRQIFLPGDAGFPHKIWLYKYFNTETNSQDFRLIMLTTKGEIYWEVIYGSDQLFSRIGKHILDLNSVAVNYNLNGEDVLLICSPNGSMGYINGNNEYIEVVKDENQPDICDMTIHYERLFAISKKEPRRLYFSDDLDPTNWNINLNDAGFIDFSDELGELKRVFSFNDYLYIVREFGISKLSAFGNQEQFYVNHCFSSNTKIYENTAHLCGNNLIFLARDGLYSFNGSSAAKINIKIDNMFVSDNKYSIACFHKGKYFLACKLDYADDLFLGCENCIPCYNNTLLAFDVQTGELSLTRGVDVKCMLNVEDEQISELICLFNTDNVVKMGRLTKTGKIFEENALKRWVSPLTDLGYGDKRKVIKEIYLRTKYDCYIYVTTESATKKIKVCGGAGVKRVPVNIIGSLIAINFESVDAKAEISNPQIIINLLGAL